MVREIIKPKSNSGGFKKSKKNIKTHKRNYKSQYKRHYKSHKNNR